MFDQQDKWTALNLASQNGHVEVVRALLVANAATEIPDGVSSIHFYSLSRHIALLYTMISLYSWDGHLLRQPLHMIIRK